MSIQSIDLVWIVVKDLKSAIMFYQETLGLKLLELHEQYGWAELAGQDGGARLGIAQKSDMETIQPGQNAVMTLKVPNLAQAIKEYSQKKVKMVGTVLEVPGQVKLQMAMDADGNHFQLVEVL